MRIAREKGVKRDDILNQADAFDPLHPVTGELVRSMFNKDGTRAASRTAMADTLRQYARSAATEAEPKGLLPGDKGLSPLEILKAINDARDAAAGKKGAKAPGQGGLFDAGREGGPILKPVPKDWRFDAEPATPDGASTLTLKDAAGAVQYKAQILEDSPGVFGLGQVENISRSQRGIGAAFYRDIADHVNALGGKLYVGIDATPPRGPCMSRWIKQGHFVKSRPKKSSRINQDRLTRLGCPPRKCAPKSRTGTSTKSCRENRA